MPSVNRIIDVRLPCMAGCGQDTRLRGCRNKVRGTRQSGCELTVKRQYIMSCYKDVMILVIAMQLVVIIRYHR